MFKAPDSYRCSPGASLSALHASPTPAATPAGAALKAASRASETHLAGMHLAGPHLTGTYLEVRLAPPRKTQKYAGPGRQQNLQAHPPLLTPA